MVSCTREGGRPSQQVASKSNTMKFIPTRFYQAGKNSLFFEG
jgi:hypothetical protein